MMMKLLFGAPLLLAFAAPTFAQAMDPAQYVATAGASDLYERKASRLVLATTQDPKIKSFATMMITDHTKSTAEVKAAAMSSNVPVMPPKLMPPQVEMIAQLRAATGPARDAVYITQQKTAHEQALAVQKAYAMDGTAPKLKAAATEIVPVVEKHIAVLQTM